MPLTQTPGITINAAGHLVIDKEYRGIRIFQRLGAVSEREARESLRRQIDRIDSEIVETANRRPRFKDCAARYLANCRRDITASNSGLHIRLVLPYIGELEAKQVHDGTLRAFVEDRLAAGASPTTVNRSLEVVRTILNRAARSYRDDDGRPWLEGLPPSLTMLPETRRPPFPLTWDEQDRLFPRLPVHLARMVLFAVNTGLRDGNVCGLEWSWEVSVPEVGRSVFVIPTESYKSRRPHIAIMNDVAWSIVQEQRGKHKKWVFPYRDERITTMNNTAWQNARRDTAAAWKEEFGLEPPRGLAHVRVHDLRHTFGARLRASGVTQEDREALLGHASRSMAGLYGSADIGRLIEQANLAIKRQGTRPILRLIAWDGGPVDKGSRKGPAEVIKAGRAGLKSLNLARPAGFEPTTPWFVARYSIQLSYGREVT